MKTILPTLLAACLLAGACEPRCQPDRLLEPDEILSGLSFALIDRRTGRNIFPLFTNGDNFRLTDSKGNNYELGFTPDATFRVFGILKKTPEDILGLERQVEKSFFLYLSSQDTDTIKYVYRLQLDECKEPQVLSGDEVWFNGKIVRREVGGVYNFLK
jgi:hypothetical protein